MPIDPFDPGTSVAQEFPTQEPDKLRRIAQIFAAQKRAMFDLRASVLANVSDIVADLQAQVAATAAATAAVAAAQITLTAQQATLTSQQATLTAAVANIGTLVGQQTTGDVGNAISSSVAVGTGGGNYGVITFTVPAGFTTAQVSANSSMYSSWGNTVILTTQIAGTNGITMMALSSGGPDYANGSSNFARKFAVTPGGTYTVLTVASTGSGSVTAYITTTASVTYYR